MGKNMLKLTLTMYDEDEILPVSNPPPAKQSDGIRHGQIYCDLGGQKVIVLAVVPNIPESYDNSRIIFDKVQIQKILFTFAGDLKMIKIIGEMMS